MWSQEVRALSEEISAEESRYHYITMMRDILEKQLDRINVEMKLYVSTAAAADKKKSLRSVQVVSLVFFCLHLALFYLHFSIFLVFLNFFLCMPHQEKCQITTIEKLYDIR